MKMPQFLLAVLALAFLSIGAAHAQDIPPYIDPALAKLAKVSEEDARKIALKRHNGSVADVRITKESGGSGLRWIYQIKQPGGGSYEVEIDANTGKVLEDVRSGITQ
jgi:uncharacterized membrane protein YkoI